ncbi:secreted RxLR effector protein 161-like [Melitaea cinxia]|uniref:secreted RxLR effector protein 161-like n=1 Tax=Melitaea cinxia TaxID=113334 RepID=UPI001E272495|nr:secreted RxLR effector protein 161-like [Melitaea cinxia]
MGECKPVSTPMEIGLKGLKLERAQKEEEIENIPYQALIGSLMYLAIAMRPDIMFTISYLSQYNTCFGKTHWQAAKRVLRYLKGTKNIGIRYKKTGSALIGMADADWVACTIDRRSYTGYIFKYGGGLVSYATKKQRVVASSTAEAEDMAMTEAEKKALHLKQLLEDIGVAKQAVPTYHDNLAAQKLANNLIK